MLSLVRTKWTKCAFSDYKEIIFIDFQKQMARPLWQIYSQDEEVLMGLHVLRYMDQVSARVKLWGEGYFYW